MCRLCPHGVPPTRFVAGRLVRLDPARGVSVVCSGNFVLLSVQQLIELTTAVIAPGGHAPRALILCEHLEDPPSCTLASDPFDERRGRRLPLDGLLGLLREARHGD